MDIRKDTRVSWEVNIGNKLFTLESYESGGLLFILRRCISLENH